MSRTALSPTRTPVKLLIPMRGNENTALRIDDEPKVGY